VAELPGTKTPVKEPVAEPTESPSPEVFPVGELPRPPNAIELPDFPFRPPNAIDLDKPGPPIPEDETLMQAMVRKGSARLFNEDVDDPNTLMRAVSITAGGFGSAALADRLLPPGTPGLVRGGVFLGSSAFGTFVGAVAPELAIEIAEQFSILPPGTREKIGLDIVSLQTVVEGEMVIDAAFGTGFVIMRQLARIAGRTFTGSGSKAAEELAKKGEKFNIFLLPVQVGQRTIARGYTVVFGRFPLLAGPIKKSAAVAEKAAQETVEGIANRIAPLLSNAMLSEEIFLQSTRLMGAINRKFNIEYTRIFQMAERMGVTVLPKATSLKARQLLALIEKKKTSLFGKKAPAAPIMVKFEAFLKEHFSGLERFKDIIEPGKVSIFKDHLGRPIIGPDIIHKAGIQPQSLEQMDAIITKIDEFMAILKNTGEDKFISRLATQLRQAVQLDNIKHLDGENIGDALEIVTLLKATDKNFSVIISELIGSATANQLKGVIQGGLRATGEAVTTRIPIDQLSKAIIKLDSPQSIKELRKLVGAKTYKRIVANVIQTAVEKAMKPVEGSGGLVENFNLIAFAKELGLGKKISNRRSAISSMLEEADAPFKIKDLEDLVDVLKAIESVDIPKISTFVARRAMLGGFSSALGAFIPSITLGLSAGAGSAIGSRSDSGILGFMLGGILFIGGGRFLSKIISNPDSSRLFMTLFDKNVSVAIKRVNYMKAGRLAIKAIQEENFGEPGVNLMMQYFNEVVNEFDEIWDIEGKSFKELFGDVNIEIDLEGNEPLTLDLNR